MSCRAIQTVQTKLYLMATKCLTFLKTVQHLWTTYQVMPQLTLGAGAIAMDKVYGDLANTK